MVENNTKLFGDQVCGVHGQELPHFSKVIQEGETEEDMKQYWKH